MKKRIGIRLRCYRHDDVVLDVSRRVPARIRALIATTEADKYEIDINYGNNMTNGFIRATKDEANTMLSLFLSKDLIESLYG